MEHPVFARSQGWGEGQNKIDKTMASRSKADKCTGNYNLYPRAWKDRDLRPSIVGRGAGQGRPAEELKLSVCVCMCVCMLMCVRVCACAVHAGRWPWGQYRML